MAANNKPIFPKSPYVGIATLTSPAVITSRAIIAGVTGLTKLTDTATEGRRIHRIEVRAKETTVSGIVSIWIYNGTTSYLFDEVEVGVVTASNTAAGFNSAKDYENLFLGPTDQLYISATVDQDFNVFAFGGPY